MTQISASPMIEKDVLFAFSVEPNHDRATLETYLARFPQHAEALAQLSVELMLFPSQQSETCDVNAPEIDRAWEKFRSTLTIETKSDATAKSLLASLSPSEFRGVARHLDVTPVFLAFLRDHAIRFSEIPRKLMEMLAAELKAPVESVADDLQGSPLVAASQKFKADSKPTPGTQISFIEAMETSHLTQQQIAKLTALLE